MQPRRVLIGLSAVIVSAAIAITALLNASTATAQTVAPAASTTTSVAANPVAISPGFAFTGADISTPSSTTVERHLDAYKTAVFVQSFFPIAITTKVKHQRPPANARVYRVDVTGTWNGGTDLSTRSVFFASDGTHAWITSAPANTPVSQLDFWIAPDRVVSAFEGTATLVPTAGTNAVAPTTTTTVAPQHQHGSGSGSGRWWLAAALVVVVIAAIAAIVLRSRRRTQARTHRN